MINLSYNKWIFFQQLIRPVLFIVSGVTGADEISKVPGTCKRMYSNSSTKKFYLNKKKPSVYDPNYFYVSGF